MIRENGSKRSQGVLSLLPILLNLVSNRYPQVLGKPASSAWASGEGEDMLFALLGGQVDGAASHYQPPVPRGQSEAHGEGQKQQEQGSRSRVPSQTPHLSYPQMLTKSQPQSAPSQDTPLHTPEQSQMVISSEQQDQSMAPLSISQNPAQMDGNPGNSGPEMFATASSLSLSNTQSNRPQSSSGGAWMMPVMDSNCGPIVLPLAPPVPTSTPFDGYVSAGRVVFGSSSRFCSPCRYGAGKRCGGRRGDDDDHEQST